MYLTAENFVSRAPSLHDAICTEWRYESESKRLCLHLRDSETKMLCFEGVFIHEMTGCDFWGPSPHILAWELVPVSERRLYPRIRAEMDRNSCDVAALKAIMELKITFTSGDHLTVLCRSITVC